jgi:hypothetical protein
MVGDRVTLNPTMRACDNPYCRWFWRGWLWGTFFGVLVSTIVAVVSALLGWRIWG